MWQRIKIVCKISFEVLSCVLNIRGGTLGRTSIASLSLSSLSRRYLWPSGPSLLVIVRGSTFVFSPSFVSDLVDEDPLLSVYGDRFATLECLTSVAILFERSWKDHRF